MDVKGSSWSHWWPWRNFIWVKYWQFIRTDCDIMIIQTVTSWSFRLLKPCIHIRNIKQLGITPLPSDLECVKVQFYIMCSGCKVWDCLKVAFSSLYEQVCAFQCILGNYFIQHWEMVKNDNCFKTVLKNYAFLDVQMNFVQLYKCLVFPKSLTNYLFVLVSTEPRTKFRFNTWVWKRECLKSLKSAWRFSLQE